MTATHAVTLHCEGERCIVETIVQVRTVHEARKRASGWGWTFTRLFGDLCGRCSNTGD